MKPILLPLPTYLGFLFFFLVFELFVYSKLQQQVERFRLARVRGAIVSSYILLGLAFAAIKILPPMTALLPAFLASAVAYYVLFIKYKKNR
ncbi:Hypothetical protein LUCI_3523 [Lucifera butyrica]|uniref:Uncharacterized protein n=1 Tax=Lucifera butyrica TaxID=1351585 RepID=A0A498RDP7_9FIRM|nr:hypothetical protein [Lucifera butyrica]VBB08252.1 Hypothetical protein LUCI_3523 [Lucifera butyrica]